MSTFEDLKLNSWIVEQCRAIGVKKPTPIQVNCIPRILEGDDCIGCAKTGSGKTLAFALPILQKLCEDPYGIFALVLTPTRELAAQIAEQFSIIGKAINLRKCLVIGGMDMLTQSQELSKRPHIVVSTPGRLADHLEDGADTFSLDKIKFLVLDEADRLLGGDFDKQIQTIFKSLPKKRQNLLFSATMTDTLETLKQITPNKIFEYEEKDDDGLATVQKLKQYYVLINPIVRDAYLVQVICNYREENDTGSIIIFTDTCENCQLISMTLNEIGFENVALHGLNKQRERLGALTKFKSNYVKILIATGVAARGLDISSVALVINHVIPTAPKEYIHRVGRTARAGRGGQAISLIGPNELNLLGAIEQAVGKKLEPMKINDNDVKTIFTQVSMEKRKAGIILDEAGFYEKKLANKRKKLMMEGKSLEEIEEILGPKKKHKKKEKKVTAEKKASV